MFTGNKTSKTTSSTPNSDNNADDIPPHILSIMHEFILGVHDLDIDPRQPHMRPTLARILPFIIFFYGLLVVVGVSANFTVLVHIMRHRLYRDPTYAFLVNNAIADVCKLIIVLPPTLFVMLIQNWMLGEVLCSFLPMIQDIPIHVSTLTFLLMAWDRYRMVRNPAKLRLPSFVCTSGSWLTAMCLVLPYPIYILYVDLGKFFPIYENIGLCIVNLTEDMQEYMRGMFLFMYVAPVATIAYLFLKVSRELNPDDDGEGPTAVGIRAAAANSGGEIVFETRSYREFRRHSRSGSHQSNDIDTRLSRFDNDQAMSSTGQRLSTSSTTGPATNSGTARPHNLDAIDNCTTTFSSVPDRNPDSNAAATVDNLIEPHLVRERRTQKYLVAIVTVYASCICPLMVMRLARLALIETYENAGHFDMVYTVLVWVAFLPTCSTPLLFAAWQMDRPAKERLRGYFRISTHRKPRQYSCDTVTTTASQTERHDALAVGNTAVTGAIPLVIPITIIEETQLTTVPLTPRPKVSFDNTSMASSSLAPISVSGSSQALLATGRSPRASIITIQGGRISTHPPDCYEPQEYYYRAGGRSNISSYKNEAYDHQMPRRSSNTVIVDDIDVDERRYYTDANRRLDEYRYCS